jgi:predicted nucleotidyltransferase
MKDRILSVLDSIEKENDVRILIAVESGSRAWGFASPDSDFDVRFVYIHRPEWYLSVEQRPDCIELPVDAVLDVNGWDFKKALLLFKKSNPTLFEWLCSPILYREAGSAAQKLRELGGLYFSPVHAAYHYLCTAANKYKECAGLERIRIKKYFYMLRPLFACMWIEKYGISPPMEFHSLMEGLELDNALVIGIKALLGRKAAATEAEAESADPLLMGFIAEQIAHFEQTANSFGKAKAHGYEAVNDLFLATLKETWG